MKTFKYILSSLFIVCIFSVCIFANEEVTECQNLHIVYGDADGSGKVGLSDVTVMLKSIAGWNCPCDKVCGDTDTDGNFSLTDVTLTLKFLAGWNVSLGTNIQLPPSPPSCVDSGLTAGVACAGCLAEIVPQTVILPLGHTEVTDEAVAPTYLKEGLTQGSHCSVCGAVICGQMPVPVLSPKTEYKGIDVSLYQGDIDFDAVKASGIDFVIIKASQGRLRNDNEPFTDPRFEENIKKADKAGLLIGVYHYFCARNEKELEEEYTYYTKLLEPYRDKITLWAAVDVEDSYYLGNMTYLQRTDFVKRFCDAVNDAGFSPLVYSNSYWMNGNYFTAPSEYPIWEANWSCEEMPERATVWQYSSKGKVEGISGDVDLDVAYSLVKTNTDEQPS